ncbi:hypothetical protein B0H14DRAFT_2561356 [Mycena olivaceomarginata]|nr:hypothetical protein B0H14DRAFT_2561356 [Mycena olivaceomarginata]
MMFLGSHFVVERHREALLWFWIVAKWGSKNGMLTPADKDKMWEELGGTGITCEPSGIREPFSDFNASQPRPQYAFVSGDGYIHAYLPIIPDTPSTRDVPDLAVLSNNIACEISRQECLGFEPEPAWDLFKRALAD